MRAAFQLLVDAARARQALLDLNTIEREVGKSPWRGLLKELRHDRCWFAATVRDGSARIALRWALRDLGLADRAGHRWLHHLRDHPAVLRRTIDRALDARLLQRESGEPIGTIAWCSSRAVYRQKVAALDQALANPLDKTKAMEIVRSQIERITLTPGEDGELAVVLQGDLARILQLCEMGERKSKRPGTNVPGRGLSVVAGARNHLCRTLMAWVRPYRSAYNQWRACSPA